MRRSSSFVPVLVIIGSTAALAAACNTAGLTPQGPVDETTLYVPDGSSGDDDDGSTGTGNDGSIVITTNDDASAGDDDATTTSGDSSTASDGSTQMSTDSGRDGGVAMACASSFGTALSTGFGRIDGTLYSVVHPTDSTCKDVDTTRLTLEVAIGSSVYRLLVNLQNPFDAGTSNPYEIAINHSLPSPAYSAGWHSGQTLDYATDLGVHSTSAFVQYSAADLQTQIESQLVFGDPISIYAYAIDDEAGRYIYREGNTHDGAIVIGPTSTNPTWLLFHFDGQTF